MADDNVIKLGSEFDPEPAASQIDGLVDHGIDRVQDLGRVFDDVAESKAQLGGEVSLATGAAADELGRLKEAADKAAAAEQGVEQGAAAIGRQFDTAEAAVGRLSAAVAEGSPRMASRLTPAAEQVERLRRAIEATRATGGAVPQEWLSRLDRLQEEYQQASRAVGEFRRIQKDVQDDLRRSTIAAGEAEGQVNSLMDALTLKFPKAEQAIVGGVVALAAFRQAFSETRQAVEGLKSLTGIDIDSAVRGKFEQLLGDYDRLIDKVLHAGREERELANMERVLTAAHIEHGASAEAIRKAYEGMGDELRKTHVELERLKDIDRDFVAAAAGLGVDQLKTRIETLLIVFQRFGGDFDAIARSPLFEKFTAELAASGQALDLFGEDFRKSLTGKDLTDFDQLAANFQAILRDRFAGSLVEARVALKAFGVQTPQEIARAAESLGVFIRAVGGIGKATSEQADMVHDAALRILGSIADLPAGQRRAVAEITAELRKLVLEYGKAADSQKLFAEDGYAAQKAADEKLRALYEQRRKEMADLAKGISETWADLLRLAKEPVKGPEAPERRAAAEELAGLKAKPTKTLEEVERQADLERQLRQTTAAAEGQSGATRALGVSAQDAAAAVAELRKQVAGSGADFANLSTLQRKEIDILFGRLAQTAQESGHLAAGAIDETFARINSILQEANLNAALAGRGLAQIGQQAQGLGAATAAAAPGVTALAEASKASGEAAGASGSGYILAHRGVEGLTGAVGGLQKVHAELTTATDGTVAGTLRFRDATVEVNTELDGATGGFVRVGDQIIKVGKDAETAAPAMGKVAEGTADIAKGAGAAGEGLSKVGAGVETVASHGEKASAALAGLGKAATDAGKEATSGAQGVTALAAAASKAATPVLVLARSLAAVTAAKAGSEFEAIGKGAGEAAEALPDVAKGIGAVGDEAKKRAPEVKGYREEIEKLRAEVRGLASDYDTATAAMARQLKACEDLQKCRAADMGDAA